MCQAVLGVRDMQSHQMPTAAQWGTLLLPHIRGKKSEAQGI